MADSKLSSSILSILLLVSLIFTSVSAESEQSHVIEEIRSEIRDDSSVLKIELHQLKSKIQILETRLEESNRNLRAKDEKIAHLEVITQEKSDIVASLQSEIEAAQKKGTLDAEDRVGKAHAHASELQKQVENLKKEVEGLNKEKEALESRIKNSDKRVEELGVKLDEVENLKKEVEGLNKEKKALESRIKNSDERVEELGVKLDELQKINVAQEGIIVKTERALQIAEEEMMKAKSEANTRSLELNEVHYSWLPPWLLNRVLHLRSFIEAEWNEHGKPAMEILMQKTLQKKGQAEKWAEPHIETMKTKLLPAMKEHWVMVTEYVEPHVQSLTAKTSEAFEASKTAVKPHIIKVQELADPYYQEVKRASKPYIDQVATKAKPHVEKARIVLKPYIKKAVHVYGKFLESATMYHNQVQAAVHEKLKQHEVTEALATKELVWFVASALLALPVIFLSRICSAMFFKPSKKPSRHSHAHHSRRKGKRGHSDK